MEPPIKKSKLYLSDKPNDIINNTIDEYIDTINSSKNNLKAIISDEFYQPIQLVNVFVGHVKDVKDISKAIQVLNEKVPLKSLEHLKRVKRQDIILCPTLQFDANLLSIQNFIECYVPELQSIFEFFKEVEVPLNPPRTDRQCQEARKIWSCNFHPNKYLERLVGDNFFTQIELSFHRQYMSLTFEVARWYLINKNIDYTRNDVLKDINVTIIVDPSLKNIVAISFDNRKEHPIQHSTMLAIDEVAKTQNGGAWNIKTNTGVPEEILSCLKEKFTDLKLYQNNFEVKGPKEGPYLCTGYYIYTIREPCGMCAMALVHARARRVFFCIDNTEFGALKTKTKLQTIASLNHHFEVFTKFI